ncbi:hypothetical protein J4413_04280 [Candidatus Woesearchaeota archaeon]|nr:hypothetical protein [Candidatus Woesearchaeota archaeon]
MELTDLFTEPFHAAAGFLPIDWQRKLEERTSWYHPARGVLYSSVLEIGGGLITAALNQPGTTVVGMGVAIEGMLRISSLSDYSDGDHRLFGLRGTVATEVPWYFMKGAVSVVRMPYLIFGNPRNEGHRRRAMDEISRED